jgi:four helix bundle protein
MLSTIRMSFANQMQHRLYQFALAIARFCRTLPNSAEAAEAAGQLRRSSSGASANYRASRRGRSRKEWLAKLGIVVEELDESKHWLTMLRDSDLKNPPQNLIAECTELRAISRQVMRDCSSEATAAEEAGTVNSPIHQFTNCYGAIVAATTR